MGPAFAGTTRRGLDFIPTALFNVTDTLSIVIVRRLSPTRSGMTGRSSIPETVVLESRGRGVLDVPHSRGMTAEKDTGPCSRGTKCPSYWKQSTLENKEGAGNAGCALHPWPPVQQESTGVSNQGYTATAGIPCAMVLRLIRDLLGDHAWLPPSPTRRVSVFASLAPASERQDHTTSPSAPTPLVALTIAPRRCASIASRSQRP